MAWVLGHGLETGSHLHEIVGHRSWWQLLEATLVCVPGWNLGWHSKIEKKKKTAKTPHKTTHNKKPRTTDSTKMEAKISLIR